MEVIADELQKNGIHMDIETLSEHIEYILDNYRDFYTEAVNALNRFPLNVDMFQKVFKEETVRLQRRDCTSSRPFSRTCFQERWKSGRGLHTEPLFVGGTKSTELMGFNVNSVNNLYNK